MITFPDGSFLCALYVQQDNSPAAAAYFKTMDEPLHLSSLLLYEFRQSVRFQVWLYTNGKKKGYPLKIAEAALGKLQANMETEALTVVKADWADVHSRAEEISKRHTITGGHRSLDLLHVATALHLGAEEFLTFDAKQRKLAQAEKLRVGP